MGWVRFKRKSGSKLLDNQQQGNPEGESIMGVVDLLEDSSELAARVMFSAEKKLRLILDAAIENDDKRLRKYKGFDYNKNMDEIMEELYAHFDEIYVWDKFEQAENFYRVLENIMDGLMGK